LDVLEKGWAMGGVADGRFVVGCNGSLVELKLGASMGKHQNMWAVAAMLVLEGPGGGVRVHIKLGWKGEVFVWYLLVLMTFDVLDCGLKG
jgi:hypothetical protein